MSLIPLSIGRNRILTPLFLVTDTYKNIHVQIFCVFIDLHSCCSGGCLQCYIVFPACTLYFQLSNLFKNVYDYKFIGERKTQVRLKERCLFCNQWLAYYFIKIKVLTVPSHNWCKNDYRDCSFQSVFDFFA